jgi:hypothetical protein
MLGTRRELTIHSAYLQRGQARRLLLVGGIAAAALCATPAAEAQQYGGGTSVTVDYAVLDQMGTPQTLPEALRNSAPTTVYTQPSGGLQPYGSGTLQPYGATLPSNAPAAGNAAVQVQAQAVPVQSPLPGQSPAAESDALLPPPPA